MKNSTEIELLITLKHPDPYMDFDLFLDSLPEIVIMDVHTERWNGPESLTLTSIREGMKSYSQYYKRKSPGNVMWKIEIDAFRKRLYEYYEQQ